MAGTSSTRNMLRLLSLIWTFNRYGTGRSLQRVGVPAWLCNVLGTFAKPNLPAREGERLRLAFAAMGPTFIKLGQALSTRADLVGEEIAEDLSDLQDNLPPFPTAQAKRVIENELGQPLAALYRDFDDVPIAAASIAQVHFALTPDGAPVAVKVLRPGIRQAFARDISLFYWIADLLIRWMPQTRRLKPREVIRTFDRSIQRELDLRMEAASAERLRENLTHDPETYIPLVDWNRTATSVLTMERVDGIPISDVEALKAAGHDINQLIVSAAKSLFQQVFRDGYFHADLHPGNLFVNSKGQIVLVDFGITGTMNAQDQWFIAEILRGFLQEDFHHVAQVHIDAGYVPRHHSVDDFALACRAIAKPILDKPLQQISIGRLLGQLFAVSAAFEMETQPQLLLMQKNMVLAEGIGRMLNPNVNMWKLAEPLSEDWAKARLSPQGKAKAFVKEAQYYAHRLPLLAQRMDAALACFDEKGLRLHPETVARMEAQRARFYNRLTLLAVLLIGLIGFIALS